MDFKELIDRLRGFIYWSEEHYHYIHPVIFDEAATAIETLLAEREALMEQIRGKCDLCENRRKCLFDANERQVCAVNRRSKWKWCGLMQPDQGKEGEK